MTPKRYYFEPTRPAAHGRWVVITKKGKAVLLDSYNTEAEARKAAGLTGGSTDPRYRPVAA